MAGQNSQGVLALPPVPRAQPGMQVSAETFNQAMTRLEQAFIQISQPNLLSFQNFANDAAAAAGGIRVGQQYRTGSLMAVRIS